MKIRNLLFIFLFLASFAIFFHVNNYASPPPTGASSCTTFGGIPKNGVCSFTPSTNIPTTCSTIASSIGNIIVLLFSVAGLAFFVMLIIAGIKMTTAGGDKEKIASAQTAIIHAILGIVIVAASFLIVELISGLLGVGGALFTANPINSNCTINSK
jgi:hypothetical protein